MTDRRRAAFSSNMEIMKKRVILGTKKALLSICQDKAIECLRSIRGVDACQGLHEVFSQVFSIESGLIEAALNVLSFNVNDQMQKVFDAPPKQDACLSADLQSPSIEGLRRQLNAKDQLIAQLQGELEQSRKETQDVLEAADTLEKDWHRTHEQ